MILSKLLAVAFSLLLLIQAYAIKRLAGSYLIPGSLFSFAWFFFTFIPLVLLFDVPINPFAILYIVVAILAFSLSAIPFNWRFAFEKNTEKEATILPKLNSRFIRVSLYISIVLAVIFSVLFVLSNGFPLSSFRTDFINTSARYAALRGNEFLEYGVLGTLSVFFTYFAAVLGAIVSFYKKGSIKKLSVFSLSMAPSIFAMVVQSSKLLFFVALIFYLSSALLMSVYSSKHTPFRFGDLSKTIWPLLLITPFLILSFISREGYSDFGDPVGMRNLLIHATNSYLFGSLYAFADFFSFSLGMDSVSQYQVEYHNLGYYSFKAIFDALGGTKVFPPGYYYDLYMYKDVLATNIFSIFRSFIADFGFLGTIVFMFPFGFVFHFMFYKLLVNKNPWFASVVFLMFLGFVGLSFLISIFTARYVFLITGSLYLLFTINSRIHPVSSRNRLTSQV
jgi:oligosaccharide repeat unit polymerase